MKRSIRRTIVPAKLLNVKEAADRAGLSAYTIRKLCLNKSVMAYQVLGKWKVDPVSLDRYMAQQSNM